MLCGGQESPQSDSQPFKELQTSTSSENACDVDAGNISNVRNLENPDKVEILELVNQQISQYRLTADDEREHLGYGHSDFIQNHSVPVDENIDLSPTHVTETLKYFVLCAGRVSQMTKTFNDIETVTQLLEEKERDLELAARIGQTLLSKNKELTARTENLEEQLSAANDKVGQLRHDLALKDELLRIYNEDIEHENGHSPGSFAGLTLEDVDFLKNKVKTLEDENIYLKVESAQLKADTDSYEEKEKRLVDDCIHQIGDLN